MTNTIKATSKHYVYKGVIHVHSTHSDGFGTIDTIARAANRANCDFLLLTDHNTLAAKYNGEEGWHNNTLVLVGSEISTDTDSHLLALNIEEEVPAWLPAQQTIDLINSQGGLSFLAHPFGKQTQPYFGLTGYPWQDWSVKGYTGVEIWNYSQDWVESTTTAPIKLIALLLGLLFPDQRIQGPSPEALAKWDQLTAGGNPVVGIGSVDAHGIGLSYRRLFRRLRTHIITRSAFTGRLDVDCKIVYGALARGNCFFCNDILADATGFEFYAQSKNTRAIAGEAVPFTNDLELQLVFPRKCRFRIMASGQNVLETSGTGTSFKAKEPGTYRVEALIPTMLGLKPWLYSNPIYVTPVVTGEPAYHPAAGPAV